MGFGAVGFWDFGALGFRGFRVEGLGFRVLGFKVLLFGFLGMGICRTKLITQNAIRIRIRGNHKVTASRRSHYSQPWGHWGLGLTIGA